MGNAEDDWKYFHKRGNSETRRASLSALRTAPKTKCYHTPPKYIFAILFFMVTSLAHSVLSQESMDVSRTKDSLQRASQLITNLLDCIDKQVIPPKCPDNKPCTDNHIQGCLKNNVLGDLGIVVSQAYDTLVDNERLMNENYRLTLEYEKLIGEKNVLFTDQISQIANLTEIKKMLTEELATSQGQLEVSQNQLEVCKNETELNQVELARQTNKMIELQQKHIKLTTEAEKRKTKITSQLFHAIDQRDYGTSEFLIDIGADVNAKNNASETPLHRSALSSDKSFALKTTRLLIEHGADVFPKDDEDYTFLHRLVDDVNGTDFTLTPKQFHELASFLISKNASELFNVPGSFKKTVKPRGSIIYYNYSTPFHLAAKNLAIENVTLSILQNNSVDFNAVNEYGNSALFYAILGGRGVKLLSNLISHGANPKHLNTYNFTLLHWASSIGTVEHMRFFLDLGLGVNALDSGGWTPLHAVVIRDRGNILGKVQVLIWNNATVDIKDSEGKTPLDYVKSRKNTPDRETLLELLERRKRTQQII